MPYGQVVSSASEDQRLDRLLGDIDAASHDTRLLAVTLLLEAARTGPTARDTALAAQAMCSLSIRATTFTQRVRSYLPGSSRQPDGRKELAELRQMSRTVADLLQEAAVLTAGEFDGTGVDDNSRKLPAQLFEQIHVRLRAIDDVLDDSSGAGPGLKTPTQA